MVVLLAGLQGAGKTTTAAKLARWLTEQQRKRVLMVSTDVADPLRCCNWSGSQPR